MVSPYTLLVAPSPRKYLANPQATAKPRADDHEEPWRRRGRIIRLLREAKGWSQQKLVDVTRAANGGKPVMTTAYLSKIENGARNVGSEVLDVILAALEVPDDALSSRRAAEIEGDPSGFMVRETLATFIAKDKVGDDAEALQRMIALVPNSGGPAEVDQWRTMYPYLTEFERAKREARYRRRRR